MLHYGKCSRKIGERKGHFIGPKSYMDEQIVSGFSEDRLVTAGIMDLTDKRTLYLRIYTEVL